MRISNPMFDDVDLQIIAYLQEDGRRSFRDIAEQIGVSERTIRLRLSRMKEVGIIQIVGVVNLVKVGLQIAAIILIAVSHPHLDVVRKKLEQFPEVRFIAMTSGEYQLTIQVVSDSSENLTKFLRDHFFKIEFIEKSNVLVEMEVYKNDFGYLRNQGVGREPHNSLGTTSENEFK